MTFYITDELSFENSSMSNSTVWNTRIYCFTVTRKWRDQEITSEIPNQKPEYRMGHTATYDPTLRCVYVYGGSKNLKWFHDVHMLDVDEFKWQLLKVRLTSVYNSLKSLYTPPNCDLR